MNRDSTMTVQPDDPNRTAATAERRQQLWLAGTMAILFAIAPNAWSQEIIAHRGASKDAPENTLAAAMLAWKQGADGLEGDFHLTRDGAIVCINDATTLRTTGVEGKIADMTLDELKRLDAGIHKGSKWRGERIPTMNEWLDTVPSDGRRVFIDVKSGPDIVEPMKFCIADSGLKPEQVVFISFSDEVIKTVKEQLPDYKALLIVQFRQDKQTGEHRPNAEEILRRLRDCKADGLDSQAKREAVTPDFASAIRSAGFELHCWTIDKTEDVGYFVDLGFQSVTTNRPGLLRTPSANPATTSANGTPKPAP